MSKEFSKKNSKLLTHVSGHPWPISLVQTPAFIAHLPVGTDLGMVGIAHPGWLCCAHSLKRYRLPGPVSTARTGAGAVGIYVAIFYWSMMSSSNWKTSRLNEKTSHFNHLSSKKSRKNSQNILTSPKQMRWKSRMTTSRIYLYVLLFQLVCVVILIIMCFNLNL
jgi:hypothetical protein